MEFDARNSTEFGLLRAYTRIEATNNTGTYGYVQSAGPYYNALGHSGNPSPSFQVEKAFIQLGGLTAGRIQSFFDFYADTLNWGGAIRGSDLTNTVLAYTATFGSGFSATLSLEDGIQREVGLSVLNPLTGTSITAGYGGNRMPDIVANLRVDQGWGSAQLSAAMHQARAATALYVGQPLGDAEMGWAIQGGVKINLPMIAAGDQLWLQAAYAQGAISYLGFGGGGNGSTWSANSYTGLVGVNNADALLNGRGSLDMTTGYALTAGALHYWTPTIRQALFGSFAALDYGNAVTPTAAAVNFGSFGVSNNQVAVGSNVTWSPVKGLDIGGEVIWMQTNTDIPVINPKQTNAALNNKSNDGWTYRLRVQRDF